MNGTSGRPPWQYEHSSRRGLSGCPHATRFQSKLGLNRSCMGTNAELPRLLANPVMLNTGRNDGISAPSPANRWSRHTLFGF